MTHKSLQQVMKDAEERWNKNVQERPDLYRADSKTAYLLGWLQSSYDRMYNDLPEKMKAIGEEGGDK